MSRGRVRRITEARGVAAFLVREGEGLTLVDLDKWLKQDMSSQSQVARRVDLRLENSAGLQGRLEAAKGNIPISRPHWGHEGQSK